MPVLKEGDGDEQAVQIMHASSQVRRLIEAARPSFSYNPTYGHYNEYMALRLPDSDLVPRPSGIPKNAEYAVVAFKEGGSAGYSDKRLASTEVEVVFLDGSEKVVSEKQRLERNEVHPDKENPILPYLRNVHEEENGLLGTGKLAVDQGGTPWVVSYPKDVTPKDSIATSI